ncbi:MAG TPA: UDP-glucose--hexose-1-phosphate uridylyltransferase [Candidatus Angelobacter sp.]|nr:UDP-glucose--hexose-1-phosphate uridylyltransferase [Candidatus Angelobacter sp.]
MTGTKLLHPHKRFNPLTGEWVLVSPHRTQRPWQGQVESPVSTNLVEYDPDCYLCPGNERAGGHRNPQYTGTFIFVNDYSALYPLGPEQQFQQDTCRLIVAQSEPGICRVMCFSPRHDLTLATMDVPAIRNVVDAWADQYQELGSMDWITHVQIFENRGAMMGASNPHPHCQIWADAVLPNEPAKELERQRAYLEAHKICLLCNYLKLETGAQERIVDVNDHFVAVVPFWAVWPFEIMLVSREHRSSLAALSHAERDSLAEMLKKTTSGFDRIFQASFPYSMGFHQAPTDGRNHDEWHLHAHFYPPLLRSASIRKFMVGYELLAGPQRDITPESAADTLRQCIHTRS